MRFWVLTIVSLLLSVLGSAEQCGWQADGALCLGRGGGGVGDIGGIISEDMFNDLLKHRNDDACEGKGFYSYEAFLTASKAYPAFGTTGDDATRKKEIAAFLAQTSHETTGGWPSAPDGPYSWGYCFVTERDPPPGPGQYYGRGPIQLTWNYNYALAGEALGVDLISNPNLVATNAVISFKTAFWFWMTAQSPKPSSHDVIIGSWSPSAADTAAGRLPGYGVITNIINGGNECGKGPNRYGEDRIGFFRKYCQILGADTGDNLDCYNQEHFGSGLLLDTI